jgi:glycosyltransferase involved in cell wall biosynthesis
VRLLYLNHNVVGTGTYLRALHLGRAMVGRGHQVTLVTTSRSNRISVIEREEHGVRVVEAPDLWWGAARTGWDPWNVVRRFLHLWPAPVDLVHAFDGRPVVSIPAWLLARRTGPALVMDWADWWGRGGHIQQRSGWAVRTFFGPTETWFEEAFRPLAAAHTVISQPLRERALGMGLDPDRVAVVPNGCPSDLLLPMPRDAARSALCVGQDAPLAVHLGALTRADMSLLMGAWRIVLERLPAARLVLVGRPGTAVPPDLLASGAVHVTGYIDTVEKDRWLGAADVCVIALPDTIGNRGRWPSKINDYFSAGRAVVITDVGDAAALVRERSLGWVTEADPTSFAGGMRAALEAADDATAAGARARGVAEQELAWPTLAGRVDRLYLLTLAAAAPASGR